MDQDQIILNGIRFDEVKIDLIAPDQRKFSNIGPDQIRTKQILKILDRSVRESSDTWIIHDGSPGTVLNCWVGSWATYPKLFWRSFSELYQRMARQGSTGQNRSVQDQDQKNFRNLGPFRTRTEKILEILDQLGPGLGKFKKSRKSGLNSITDALDRTRTSVKF